MRELVLAVGVLGMTLGSVHGQGVDPGTAPRPSGPVRVSSGAMSGQIVERTMPVYPVEAKAAGVSGIVVLHAIVGKTGLIEDVTVISGPEMLQEAALDAVRNWVYKPYLLNGEPTRVDTAVTVNFSLGGRRDGSLNGGSDGLRDNPPGSSGREADPRVVTPRPQGPIRISAGVLQGMVEEKVDPIYPQTQQSGAVVMRVRVNREGEVTEVTAISGPESLRAASVEAVKQWSYRPYLLNGEPVEVDSTVTVMFTRH